jgi:hypothetical protein
MCPGTHPLPDHARLGVEGTSGTHTHEWDLGPFAITGGDPLPITQGNQAIFGGQ